jgi:predicted double-glycine peptidase
MQFQLVEVARQLGFTVSRKYTLSFIDELIHRGQFHSLVVVSIEHENVTVLHPLVGENSLTRDEFQAAWAEMRFLTIVIKAKR